MFQRLRRQRVATWLAGARRSGTGLVVPAHLNRNSATVTALMPPEQAGLRLLDRMRRDIGLESYAHVRVLDFGCGVRFSQTILNIGVAIGHYAGVDNSRDVIDFLSANVRDPRLSYHFLDARHALYNPGGQPLTGTTALPFAAASFDVASMFSVITHQAPDDARAIFTMLRSYLRPDGHLYFTCFLDDAVETFEDRSPDRNGGCCVYHPAFLADIVASCRWQLVSSAPPDGPLIASAFVCRPA
jgi:SAM-dependent methyltransferase